jgi:hypothetical protein
MPVIARAVAPKPETTTVRYNPKFDIATTPQPNGPFDGRNQTQQLCCTSIQIKIDPALITGHSVRLLLT